MTGLPAKIIAIHRALDAVDVPHAFGGALALAWCTERARGTIDIDVNVFAPVTRAGEVLVALPRGVKWSDDDLAAITRDGQLMVTWVVHPTPNTAALRARRYVVKSCP